MATTTNYGWTTPDDTALVKDGAAAIRSLGTSVDTTTKNLNPETTLGDISYRSSTANVNTRLPLGTAGQVLKVNSGATAPEWSSDNAGMTNPMTTTGDTIYSSSGSTPARLAIGSTGNVLTVAGGVPTWAAPAGAITSFSLLNTGGTALSGANVRTISGISGQQKLLIFIRNGTTGSANVDVGFRFNTDSGANYDIAGIDNYQSSTYAASNNGGYSNIGNDTIYFTYTSTNAGSVIQGSILLDGANGTGFKTFTGSGGSTASGGSAFSNKTYQGIYKGTSTISSVSVLTSGPNFTGGTIFVYGSAV
jgi:hypothetical protein